MVQNVLLHFTGGVLGFRYWNWFEIGGHKTNQCDIWVCLEMGISPNSL
jgi:hypothetical protein